MSTELTLQIASQNSEQTEQLGEQLGRNCHGGEIFELIGDLGAGKTTFVKGLTRGIGSDEDVSSPSFTINNVYKSPNLTLQHFDFYRLNEGGAVADELNEVVHDPTNVVAVEWGDIVHDVLPRKRMLIYFNYDADDGRQIKLVYPEAMQHLIKGIKS